jgi:hypothetical protein
MDTSKGTFPRTGRQVYHCRGAQDGGPESCTCDPEENPASIHDLDVHNPVSTALTSYSGKFASDRSSVRFMDPLSLSASIAGLISLTIEVTKIISEYRSGFKNAPKEASELSTEVAALHHVLETVLEILINEYSNSEDITFDEKNILFSIVDACEEHMNTIHTKMAKLQAAIKGAAKFPILMARLKWPFEREDCHQSIQIIHRYVQTLQVLLIASNRYVPLHLTKITS